MKKITTVLLACLLCCVTNLLHAQVFCQAPSASYIYASPSGCTAATLNCSVTGVDGYGFRYKLASSSSWTTVSFTATSYWNISNLTPNMQYEFQARVWCGGAATGWSGNRYFYTCQTVSGGCSNPNIVSCGNSYYGHNGSGADNYNTYSGSGISFSQMYGPEVFYQITLNQGGPLSLSLTGLSAGQDLDLILLSSCNAYSIIAASGNGGNSSEYINVNYLSAGTYRIVVDGWNYSASSYVLSVQCAGPSTGCPIPTASQLFASNLNGNSARINSTYQGATSFDWRYRTTGSASWIDLNATSVNNAFLSNLIPYTNYEFQSSVYCSGYWTNWSASQFFNTVAPYNNESCGAYELATGTGCYPIIGTNIAASTSYYPAPPGGCNTANMRDVWYKVLIPSTGKVKISTFTGSMNDAVVAFYYGNCNNLSAPYPNCFDVTNGDEMPDVTISGTTGTWWYVRVWGYGGGTGTFSICAQTTSNLIADEIMVTETEVATNRSAEGNSPTDKEKDAQMEAQVPSIRLFPVPAQDVIHLSSTLVAESDITLRIISMTGQILKEETRSNTPAGAFETRLDISTLPSGAYLLRFKAGGQETNGKFMKL